MNPRMSRVLSAVLLALATLPVLADQTDGAMLGQPFAKLAQLSPEERRALRERWEQASPEERMRMRRFFQERMRQMPLPPLPPEAREAMRLPFGGGRHEGERADKRRGEQSAEGSFGFGFERRRFEDGQPERPVWSGNRRQEDDERR